MCPFFTLQPSSSTNRLISLFNSIQYCMISKWKGIEKKDVVSNALSLGAKDLELIENEKSHFYVAPGVADN